jgi:hypothetical protein
MNYRKNPWVWVGVAVVVIIIVIAVVMWIVGREKRSLTGPVPVHAPAGQVVAGFPQQLILGAATSSASSSANVTSSGVSSFFGGITNSYSIDYSTSTNQYTAEWVSSSTLASLYKQYQDYVAKSGLTIVNHIDAASMKGIYATNASSAVNIVITPQSQAALAKGSKVTVSYVSTAQ